MQWKTQDQAWSSEAMGTGLAELQELAIFFRCITTLCEEITNNPVPTVPTARFEGLWKDGHKPAPFQRKTCARLKPKWVYTFNHRKAGKLIPGDFIYEGETHGFETT